MQGCYLYWPERRENADWSDSRSPAFLNRERQRLAVRDADAPRPLGRLPILWQEKLKKHQRENICKSKHES